MNSKEVAAYLDISMPTLHAWIKAGFLKSYRIGRKLRFKSDEIDVSLKEQKFRRFNGY